MYFFNYSLQYWQQSSDCWTQTIGQHEEQQNLIGVDERWFGWVTCPGGWLYFASNSWYGNKIDHFGRPTVPAGRDNYFHTCCTSVRPSPLLKISQSKINVVKIMIATGGTVFVVTSLTLQLLYFCTDQDKKREFEWRQNYCPFCQRSSWSISSAVWSGQKWQVWKTHKQWVWPRYRRGHQHHCCQWSHDSAKGKQCRGKNVGKSEGLISIREP